MMSTRSRPICVRSDTSFLRRLTRGLMVDANVFIQFERRGLPVRHFAVGVFDNVFISAVTVSELLMGVTSGRKRSSTETP